MVNLIHRPIGDRLLRQRSTPVLIVEGARAVGKTTMAKGQLGAEYHYVSLADSATRERATGDIGAWLRSLPLPTIIDEAQLVSGLPLELKEYVDALDSGNHFVLTGSASIGRTGLGGADPLTRRSQRLTMHPLTRWEIAGQPGSLVDALFDSIPVLGRYSQEGDAELLDELRVGGFPSYVFPRSIFTRGQLRSRLAADITAVLSDEVAPDLDLNVTKARSALDALLRTPGGIFNAASLGRQLGLDKRTVERYLNTFGRLFLLQWLPNLATIPRKQDFSRAKIHPVDLSFSVDALERSGVNILGTREFFGQVLESHVVSELLANAQWATAAVRGYYWRQASSTNPEVDLVLLDEGERAVAIEVKASSSVSPADLKGIRAFKQTRAMHRGFIFYRGDAVLQLDTNVWAMPMSTLGDAATFNTPEPAPGSSISGGSETVVLAGSAIRGTEGDFDATLFLSYVHADDTTQKGRIVKFAHDLVGTYSFLYGHNLQLFIDRDDIVWGETWSARVSKEIDATTFLLCAVTPRFLKSDACRKEVLDFSTAARQTSELRLLLPLLWVDILHTDVVADDDPVLQRLLESEYEDVSVVRRTEPDSIEYEQLVERVASRLKKTIDARANGTAVAQRDPSVDTPDLLDLMAQLSKQQESLESDVAAFKGALESVSMEFQAEPIPVALDSYGAAAVFDRLGTRLRGPSDELVKTTEALGRSWNELDDSVAQLVQMATGMPGAIRDELGETLEGLERALTVPGLDQVEPMITMIGSVSRQLRPASRALSGSILLLRGIQESVIAWRKRL